MREELKRGGWRASDRYKNFLQTRRAGIDFHIGPFGASSDADRLELRYVYVTERTNVDGTVDLPADATPERVGDVLTTIYLRVHERPDPSRTFGGKRPARTAGAASLAPEKTAPSSEKDKSQPTLDL